MVIFLSHELHTLEFFQAKILTISKPKLSEKIIRSGPFQLSHGMIYIIKIILNVLG